MFLGSFSSIHRILSVSHSFHFLGDQMEGIRVGKELGVDCVWWSLAGSWCFCWCSSFMIVGVRFRSGLDLVGFDRYGVVALSFFLRFVVVVLMFGWLVLRWRAWCGRNFL